MSLEVVMPQMGESVVEGTVTKWLVKEGDRVQEDQPLCEISTDKVDTEIPSPGTGVIAKLIAAEGETLPVGALLAVIEAPEPRGRGCRRPGGSAGAAQGCARTPARAGQGGCCGRARAARPQQPPTLRAVRSEPRPQSAAAANSAAQAPAGGASAPPANGARGGSTAAAGRPPPWLRRASRAGARRATAPARIGATRRS